MSKYNFRSQYYASSGPSLDILGYVKRFIAPINRGGNGNTDSPFNTFPSISTGGAETNFYADVLANGMYGNIQVPLNVDRYSTQNYLMLGQNMFSTVAEPIFRMHSNSGTQNISFKDLCLDKWYIYQNGNGASYNFYKCWLRSAPIIFVGSIWTFRVSRCLLGFPNNTSKFEDSGYNSYLYTDIVNIINTNALYDNCKVTIDTQARLTTYNDIWAAFNDCKFKIGLEEDWTSLVGNTEEELRANFVARCQAQSWTVPTDAKSGDAMYHWVFATNSAKNGVPFKDSIIHNFEKLNFPQTFGYETKRDGFIISADATVKNTFNPETPNSATLNAGIEFNDHSLTFTSNTDITDRVTAVSQSNIMWLGGKHKLTALDVVHNMPADFGVMVDNTPTIDFTPVNTGSIEADELYIVRSTDKKYASVTYNKVVYNTALSNNNYVFKGVAGETGFTKTEGENPVIYKLTDFVQHQTLDMRIVNKLPAGNIKSGALKNNYWYFVEHDTDQNNKTDYITYAGKNYCSGSSFLVKGGVTSFSIPNGHAVHLRRAWADDFNYETMPDTDEDKAFWRYEQKPKWSKIVIGDTPRCFMTANSDRENEMKSDSYNEYLTTGHPDFYKQENGDAGFKVPSFLIQGSYIQLRIAVSTLNPM